MALGAKVVHVLRLPSCERNGRSTVRSLALLDLFGYFGVLKLCYYSTK